jgi:hypothetical protein
MRTAALIPAFMTRYLVFSDLEFLPEIHLISVV